MIEPSMPESNPHSPNVPQHTWNLEALAQALRAVPETVEDTEAGAGILFLVGEEEIDPEYIAFELYPLAQMLRIACPGLSLTLDEMNLTACRVSDGQVVFSWESQRMYRHLSLSARGEVALLLAPIAQHQGTALQKLLTDAEQALPADRALLIDDAEYAEMLKNQEPPLFDDYGFDKAEYERLRSEEFGA